MTGIADRWWGSAEGLRLHALDYAAADRDARLPVICLHGLTRNARDFENLAPWIAAQGRRVLALDVRGRGLSAWSPDPASYQVPTYVADVLALTDALGVARALFVGTSMGGIVTMALNTVRPDLVAGAVLNDIGPEIAPTGLARIAAFAGKTPDVTTWTEAAAYAREINGSAFPAYDDTDWTAFARRIFRQVEGRIVLDYDPAIASAFRQPPASAAPPPDPWTAFEALAASKPVLLIRGGLSDILDEPISRRMRDRAPAMAYVEIQGVGHAPMLDEPAARAALAAFLETAP